MSAGFSALVAFRDIEQATITRLLASLGESQGDSAHTSPDTPESPPEIFLDNIYHISYSVQADDINPHSDFGWDWNAEFGGYVVTSHINFERRHVVIPFSYNGHPVVGVGIDAFLNRQIDSVIIPNTIRFIDTQAFRNNRLTSVIIPNSVIRINADAFRNNWLSSVLIPDGVEVIGETAFDENMLVPLIIPSSVTIIGEYAFRNNRIVSVSIPSSVTHIEQWAFANNRLESVTFHGAPPTIPENGNIFHSNPRLKRGSILVPSQYLAQYQSLSQRFGVDADTFAGQ